MKTEKKQIETKFDRDLDPYADSKTFPGNWDLSDLPQHSEDQAGGPESLEDDDSFTIDHGLEPGAMDDWHLGAYFEEHTAHRRRGWSAY